MQNSPSTLLNYTAAGGSYGTTLIHFPPSPPLSLSPSLPPYCADPFHTSPPSKFSACHFHPASCVNTAALPVPSQFLSALIPLNFLRIFMHFLTPSSMLLPICQFLTSYSSCLWMTHSTPRLSLIQSPFSCTFDWSLHYFLDISAVYHFLRLDFSCIPSFCCCCSQIYSSPCSLHWGKLLARTLDLVQIKEAGGHLYLISNTLLASVSVPIKSNWIQQAFCTQKSLSLVLINVRLCGEKARKKKKKKRNISLQYNQ